MKHHMIEDQELSDWRKSHWVQFAASFGEQSNKTFECNFADLYRVTDHGRVLYIGGNASSALREYNGAP